MIAVRYRLGIDFGTSNTVAVIHEDDGRTRPVLFDGFPLLPSCVCVSLDGEGLLVGREATHAARVRPERYEPHPKRRIDDGTVLLGDAEFTVAKLIAAVLAQVKAETVRAMGGEPGTVVLTYPASWGPRRRSVLLDAARLAGLGTPQLVPEPVAAAAFFVAATGAAVPVGSRVVVYDFGAGTFDASVVTRTAAGWEVIASEGLADAGGLDVDAAIVEYLGTVHSAAHPDEMRRLVRPQTVGDRRAHRNLWEDVRTAKEILSRSASTYIHVPLVEQDAPLGREQLERLARPVVERTVLLTRAVFANADPKRPLAGLFLVGGSSRMPLVATLLHQATGVAPTVMEQPELVVAEGSARPIATTGAQPLFATDAADAPLWPGAGPTSAPPSGAPVGADPSSRGVAAVRPVPPASQPPAPQQPTTPVSGGGVYGTPAAASGAAAAAGSPEQAFSIPPVSGRPVSSPPLPGAGWAAAGLPVSGPPDAAWSTSSPPGSSPPGPSWPDNGPAWPETGPAWPVSPAASGPAAPTSPASGTNPAAPVGPAGAATPAVASFRAETTTEPSTTAATAPPGAVRRTLITAGILLAALLLFDLLGQKAEQYEWNLPYQLSSWYTWIGQARVYLFPGFLLWLAYLFAAPASRSVARTIVYGVLLIPVMTLMSEIGIVLAWAGGADAVIGVFVAALVGAVLLLVLRRRLDGSEVQPVFGRADVGGLALGVCVAVLAAAPEYADVISHLDEGSISIWNALDLSEVPLAHWLVFGPTVMLAFAGLGAAIGRLVAMKMPAVTRWLPRIAALLLAVGGYAAVSEIGADLFGW